MTPTTAFDFYPDKSDEHLLRSDEAKPSTKNTIDVEISQLISFQ